MIRRACGRDLTNGFEAKNPWTQSFNGWDAEYLQLPEWPVASITSISIVDDVGVSTALATTDYRLDSDTGLVYKLGAVKGRFAQAAYLSTYGWQGGEPADRWGVRPNFQQGFDNVVVVYVTSAGVPEDVKYACYRILDFTYANRGRGPFQSEDLGGYKYVLASMGDQASMIETLLGPFQTGGGL